MTAIDANAVCDPTQLKTLEELAEINDQIKALEAKKQALVASVKNIMMSKNITSLSFVGKNYTLIDSQRRTISRTEKDAFISELVAKGKRHLIKTAIEPDLDSIFAEVDANLLEKAFVERYVKVTPVVTLRVT